MSAWPNAAFDLVGMCCGHFQMDFWTFFGATVLGKAFTLRPIQARVANFFFPSFFPLVLFFFFLSWNTSHTLHSLTPYPLTGLHLAPCRRPRHACASLRPHSVDANPSPPAPVRAPPKFASSSPPTHPPHPPIRPHSPTTHPPAHPLSYSSRLLQAAIFVGIFSAQFRPKIIAGIF